MQFNPLTKVIILNSTNIVEYESFMSFLLARHGFPFLNHSTPVILSVSLDRLDLLAKKPKRLCSEAWRPVCEGPVVQI